MLKYIFSILLFLFCFSGGMLKSEASARFQLVQAEGMVNTKEVGGEGLRVVSLWDDRGKAPVAADGSFTTVIASLRPQKLSLVDSGKMTRALTIALPDESNKIVFDARSTAVAVLFHDSGSFGSPQDTRSLLRKLAEKQSFCDFVSFLSRNLPDKPLEELVKSQEYIALLEKCDNEAFGQDQQVIRDSLQSAQDELRKTLQ